MIVNPQFFNYRLIIGSLIVAIVVLGIFSFTSYMSLKSHETFLEQERQLVENELSEMIMQYDAIDKKNSELSSQLSITKKDLKASLDSLRLFKSDISVISKYKRQVSDFKTKNEHLFKSFDSLLVLKNTIERSSLLAHNQLGEQVKLNSVLKAENAALNNTIEKGALLTANSFEVKALKKHSGKNITTTKASQVQNIEVCFTLAENALAEKGQKEIYIQIVNPKSNVVSDKGEVKFGSTSLIYSDKQLIYYNNNVVDVCTVIDGDADDIPFSKGTYFVTIFHKDRKLGSTQIELN